MLNDKVLNLLPDYHEDKGPIVRIRRITGYLVGSIERFNHAKRSELMDRVKHNG